MPRAILFLFLNERESYNTLSVLYIGLSYCDPSSLSPLSAEIKTSPPESSSTLLSFLTNPSHSVSYLSLCLSLSMFNMCACHVFFFGQYMYVILDLWFLRWNQVVYLFNSWSVFSLWLLGFVVRVCVVGFVFCVFAFGFYVFACDIYRKTKIRTELILDFQNLFFWNLKQKWKVENSIGSVFDCVFESTFCYEPKLVLLFLFPFLLVLQTIFFGILVFIVRMYALNLELDSEYPQMVKWDLFDWSCWVLTHFVILWS